ncbi:hypothetical protein Poli38472_007245 [Pythium oligandrum]|uniref:NADP-dependent oxidoreductase domain-containing protein n=1 Tax=Pythium oligandrum TaxID=41045 RepID=A0A8K1FD63_PYTOL|nr:hypothetical protein Poli38472_007245 [Pythium oligandrum]|eukprot:TMW59100.1 hypothetical protein Poli38472_007245 [Pythium oligandrum]
MTHSRVQRDGLNGLTPELLGAPTPTHFPFRHQASKPAMAPTNPATAMKYHFLGNTGLLVSQFSYGCFMVKERALTFEQALAVSETAFKLGVNFFDNAEMYAGGHSEEILGQVIKAGVERGTWTREDLVISTKIFYGSDAFLPNGLNTQGLSRKHIIEGTKAALKRLDLDYVDLIFCHRPDAVTPIEETVRAMNHVIQQGWAFYWGTSEWGAGDIIEACEVADRLGLIRPAFDQCHYSIYQRTRVEAEFVNLYKKYKYGLTTFSPLESGVLTGKYSKGIQEGSRLAASWYQGMSDVFMQKAEKAVKLEEVAKKVGCSLPQLALAWCASNEHVSTVLFGATTPEQVEENLKALAFIDKITPEIKAEIEAIVPFEITVLPQYDPYTYSMRAKYL